jgi:hypothetical protein
MEKSAYYASMCPHLEAETYYPQEVSEIALEITKEIEGLSGELSELRGHL